MANDGGYKARNGARDAPVVRMQRVGDEMNLGDDFPVLCETCLGPNPYVRMVKMPYGQKLCKISNAPYQAFRWKAGPGGRYKETIVSYQVAKQRNICQACLNDMEFGLPVGVRDQLLTKVDNQLVLPQSEVGQRYFYDQQAQESSETTSTNISQDMQNLVPSRQLMKFARTMQVTESKNKTAFRNLPKLCSFWANGTCTRVLKKSCPFRPCCGTYVFPELASTHRTLMTSLISSLTLHGPANVMKTLDNETKIAFKDSQKGNKEDAIKKRVHGDDDLSKKYLGKMKTMHLELPPPEDTSICTLWVGNIDAELTENDIHSAFFPYGPVIGVYLSRPSKCAFVEMGSREAAEYAAQQLYGALIIQGRPLSLHWARPKALQEMDTLSGEQLSDGNYIMPAPPGMEGHNIESYSLPGLAPPIVSTISSNYQPPLPPPLPAGPPPPPNPPKGRPRDESSEDNNQENKRKASNTKVDTSQIWEPYVVSALPARNFKKAQGRASVPPIYPSMDPLRMGSNYNAITPGVGRK